MAGRIRHIQGAPLQAGAGADAGLHRGPGSGGPDRAQGRSNEAGGDVARVNPTISVELIIDHSVIADVAGTADAFETNWQLEFARNAERYRLLCWA